MLRYRENFYAHAHPGPEDVLLVVEAVETSLEYERQEKIPRYAQPMVPESWLFDAVSETVTQYTDQDGARYRQVRTLGRGQVLVSHTVNGLQLSVDSIFGWSAAQRQRKPSLLLTVVKYPHVAPLPRWPPT